MSLHVSVSRTGEPASGRVIRQAGERGRSNERADMVRWAAGRAIELAGGRNGGGEPTGGRTGGWVGGRAGRETHGLTNG